MSTRARLRSIEKALKKREPLRAEEKELRRRLDAAVARLKLSGLRRPWQDKPMTVAEKDERAALTGIADRLNWAKARQRRLRNAWEQKHGKYEYPNLTCDGTIRLTKETRSE